MKKACLYALMALCFLLLLSALIVTPESASLAMPSQEVPASVISQFELPVILMENTQNDAQWFQRLSFLKLIVPVAILCALALVLSFSKKDANGRVLVCKRYEESVYQLFRQEVAGG